MRNGRRKREARREKGTRLRCSHSCIHPRTKCEVKSFPQDQGRHFRDYVPSSATWIDPKTIRHSLSGTLFSQNNQSERKQLKKHVRRSQKSREWFLFLSMFVLCKKPSRPIAKHNILTDISLSFCIVRFPSLIFFSFFVPVSQEIGCFRIIKQHKICMHCAKLMFKRRTLSIHVYVLWWIIVLFVIRFGLIFCNFKSYNACKLWILINFIHLQT